MYKLYDPCGTPPPVVCGCPEPELGGVRGLWVQKKSYTFMNINDPAEWEAAVCNQNIFIFPTTNGTMAMAPNMSPGYGDQPQTTDSFTFTVEAHDPLLVFQGSGLNGNLPFWSFMQQTTDYLVGFKTASQVWLGSAAAQITTTTPIAADVKTKVDIMVSAVFVQQSPIVPVPAAAGIWSGCIGC